jgi:hypothetical protein
MVFVCPKAFSPCSVNTKNNTAILFIIFLSLLFLHCQPERLLRRPTENCQRHYWVAAATWSVILLLTSVAAAI